MVSFWRVSAAVIITHRIVKEVDDGRARDALQLEAWGFHSRMDCELDGVILELTNDNRGNDLAAASIHKVKQAELLVLVGRLLEDFRVLAMVLATLRSVLLWREDDDRVG